MDALTTKLTNVGKALTDLDDADKKRKTDRVEADKKRQGDLKDKLEAAQKKLKAKRQAVQGLREKMANSRNAADKATYQAQVDGEQFEADLLAKQFDEARAKNEEYWRVKKAKHAEVAKAAAAEKEVER